MRANRRLTRIAAVIVTAGCVMEGISFIRGLDDWFHMLAIVVFIVGPYMTMCAETCPNCKKQGLGLHFFAKNAGRCRCCGELIEYDDGKWG